jgi:branched-subunit amino acid transport protein
VNGVPLVVLWALMWAVTYPSRALPMLAPGIERLPSWAVLYLRLVGPAVLAAIAASQTLVAVGADGQPVFHVGVELPGVLACIAIVWWRKSLLLGLLAAVVLVAVLRAIGVG